MGWGPEAKAKKYKTFRAYRDRPSTPSNTFMLAGDE